jgi:hypothetical protein
MQNNENENLFPLDDAAIDSLAELAQQESNANVARNAILAYFLRQHKLSGNWRLALNGRELVRVEQPQPAAPAQ